MPDEYEPTDLQFPSDDEPVAVTPTLPSKKPKQPALVDVTGTGENEKATSRFFDVGDSMPNNKPLDNGWDDEEGKSPPQKKPVAATQKSSRRRVYALLAALGAVAAGAIYLRSNGEDGGSAKTEKPSADATTKPEPQQPQQSQKPDEAVGVKYQCRFNYDASGGGKVKAECDGIRSACLKIVFDPSASTRENAIGQLVVDTLCNKDLNKSNFSYGGITFSDFSCGITLAKPADRTKSQQLDVVGKDGKIIKDGKLECEAIHPKMP